MEQIIEVVISPEGLVTIHVRGVAGMACTGLTAGLVVALGGEVLEQEFTLEAYQAPVVNYECSPEHEDA